MTIHVVCAYGNEKINALLFADDELDPMTAIHADRSDILTSKGITLDLFGMQRRMAKILKQKLQLLAYLPTDLRGKLAQVLEEFVRSLKPEAHLSHFWR